MITGWGIFPHPFSILMTPSSDLLERCRKDDRKAHYELYTLCFGYLMSVCRRYYVNREDMQSSLNQIYVKMIRNMSSYLKKQDHVPFELWARRIAINHVVDEFRRNKKFREQIDLRDLHESEEHHPFETPHLQAEQLEEIRDAIGQLSEMNRAVFNLFVVDGYGHEEIAGMLNISAGTSKAHLHRAKKRLRELLEKEQKRNKVIDNTLYQ